MLPEHHSIGDNPTQLCEPCCEPGRAMMIPALRCSLCAFELRDRPPLRHDPPEHEGSIANALPTVVTETQEGQGRSVFLSALLPISSGKWPELDQPCLVGM